MGRRLPPAAATAPNLRGFAQLAADTLKKSRVSGARSNPPPFPRPARAGSEGAYRPPIAGRLVMEGCPGRREARLPLSEVVADCVSRWFQDTLKEARSGDVAAQVLVGQMYYSGYGVPRNVQKGKAWISKASQFRSSACKISDKHPGYNASDSDSDCEVKENAKLR
ncbi:hypothetical protein Taro_034547 [Colocasia esculenta]|uniref:Uncharacterized protein n=1 Tax=Colocasia esculenta TaxID=4460 RepID=A0A843W384_COLES|nr:hypothetical protein [Colocasia esculenta]